jgi:type 1 fimbria pilin
MFKILPILLLLFFSSSSFADDGICHNADGDTNVINLSFGTVNVSAANNLAGYTVKDALTSMLPSYPVRCHCDPEHDNDGTFYEIFYIGDPAPGLMEDRIIDGQQYYILNDYLSIGVKVFIINNDYANLPFEHLSNKASDPLHTCGPRNNGRQIYLDSSRSAKISFNLRHSVTGITSIPRTEVAWIYAGINNYYPRTTPVSKVTIMGSLIAPQNCEMTPGQTIDVDLGKMNAGDFSTTPGAVVPGKKVKTVVKVSCSGMSDVKDSEFVQASIVAVDRSPDASMIATTNPDVGIKVYDKNSSQIRVDGGMLPADMSAVNRLGFTDGSVTFYSSPASMTGKRPAASKEFTADATLILEFTN